MIEPRLSVWLLSMVKKGKAIARQIESFVMYLYHGIILVWVWLLQTRVIKKAVQYSLLVNNLNLLFDLKMTDNLVSSRYNADQCDPQDQAFWEGSAQQAVLINGHGELYSNPFVGELAKLFNIKEVTPSSVADICSSTKEASMLGPVRFLMFIGHGNPFTYVYNDLNNQYISTDHFFNTTLQSMQDLSCLSDFTNQPIILFESCEVSGKDIVNLVPRRPDLSFDFNIQKLIALYVPYARIYAPDFIVKKKSTWMVFSPSEVAYGLSGGFNALMDTLFSINGPSHFSRKYSAITPENADFCDEVISYHLLKQYCDAIPRMPYSADIQNCVEDPDCEKLIDYLYRIQPINVPNKKEGPIAVDYLLDISPSLLFHRGIYSAISAAAISFSKEYCKDNRYKNTTVLPYLITIFAQLPLILEQNQMSKSVLSVLFNTSITFLMRYNKKLSFLANITSLAHFGHGIYSCYCHPERLPTKVAELALGMTGAVVGDKLGQWAYHHYLSKIAKKESKSTQITHNQNNVRSNYILPK